MKLMINGDLPMVLCMPELMQVKGDNHNENEKALVKDLMVFSTDLFKTEHQGGFGCKLVEMSGLVYQVGQGSVAQRLLSVNG